MENIAFCFADQAPAITPIVSVFHVFPSSLNYVCSEKIFLRKKGSSDIHNIEDVKMENSDICSRSVIK